MQISIRKKVALSIGAYFMVAMVLWLLNYYNSHIINEKLSIVVYIRILCVFRYERKSIST